MPWPRRILSNITSVSRDTARFQSTKPRPPPVIGSAPNIRRHLLIRSTHDRQEWLSHVEEQIPVLAEVSKLSSQEDKNWLLDQTLSQISITLCQDVYAKDAKEEPPRISSATLYPEFIDIPTEALTSAEDTVIALSSIPSIVGPRTKPAKTHIYVCVHGSRDCRCSEVGEALYESLRHEIRLHEVQDYVKVYPCTHLGGHKWAGNMLIYSEGFPGDWYGGVTESDAKNVIAYVLSNSPAPMWDFWRGRLGLSSAEVRKSYLDNVDADPTAMVFDHDGKQVLRRKARRSIPGEQIGDPVRLEITSQEGEPISILGFENETLMQAIRRHGIPPVEATCGGFCECATCHVYLVPKHEDEGPFPPIPDPRDEEEDELDLAPLVTDDSRLSCQVAVTKELGQWIKDGGRIGMPKA